MFSCSDVTSGVRVVRVVRVVWLDCVGGVVVWAGLWVVWAGLFGWCGLCGRVVWAGFNDCPL